jgi:hypothetical protein
VHFLKNQTFLVNECEKNECKSQYAGVLWIKRDRKWKVQFKLKGKKLKCGGIFIDELDAAKKVNQLCEELGIPPKNPGISGLPNRLVQVTR